MKTTTTFDKKPLVLAVGAAYFAQLCADFVDENPM